MEDLAGVTHRWLTRYARSSARTMEQEAVSMFQHPSIIFNAEGVASLCTSN
jgi:hypothetical protein